MKTLLIEGKEKVSVVEREMPAITSDEVLIKIGFVGFCGSDLNTYLGHAPKLCVYVTSRNPANRCGSREKP